MQSCPTARGLQAVVIWLLRGTRCGVPTHGPVARTPVDVLGASHCGPQDGKVLRKWRTFDELTVLAQIHAGRVASQSKGLV